ncbi:MAG: TraB/GumN family protein [Microscillaceae bacterium]|jgi:hypothetical protein|nr:TraB/GumN family protein [Microscillaceae bacterium]
MKNWLIFILIWGALPALAQDNLNSIFWEVKGKGISKPTYLFGTHHLHDYKFLEKNPQVATALQASDWVVGEIVIDTNEMRMAMKLTMAMFMKNTTLPKLLSKEDYEATDKCLRENMGISLLAFNNVKPIFVYQLIMVAKYMKAHQSELQKSPQMMNNPFNASMDVYFQKQARELKKELRGLESVDDQIKVLYDGYSLERQVEMLLELVYDKGGASGNEVLELSNLYIKQDLDGLFNLMQKSSREEELKSLLIDRNNNWLPQIEQMLQSGKSAFIAVGAGHLPGSYGVIAQLKKKGYTLTPISIKVE